MGDISAERHMYRATGNIPVRIIHAATDEATRKRPPETPIYIDTMQRPHHELMSQCKRRPGLRSRRLGVNSN